jgi:hypothetical protein
MRKLNHSEQLAKYVIETVEKPAVAEFCCRQSNGEYDFDLTYADGTRAAVEVTKSTSQAGQQMLVALQKRGTCVNAVLCTHSWIVEALPTARSRSWANSKVVLQDVDRYLCAIEAEGLDEFNAGPAGESAAVSNILKDLQIITGSVLAMPTPARIWISGPTPSVTGSIVNPDHLQRAIEREAQKPDIRQKRWASECKERHLFVHVDSLNDEAWSALVNGCRPPQTPALPPELTHVWAATDEALNGIVVWTAHPPEGWRDRGLIPHCWPR